MPTLRITLFVTCCLMLSACGNKGPLVLPDKKASTTPAQPEKSSGQDAAKQP